MANTLLTPNMITKEAVRLFKNSNNFIQNIETQYDSDFADNGQKIGQQLRIRLPNDYTVRTGPAMSIQDTAETNTTLVVATQKGVDVGFNSVERTMSIDRYSEIVLMPMMNVLAGNVAADIMTGTNGGICNWSANLNNSNAIITPDQESILTAGAVLTSNSVPEGRRFMITDPFSEARIVGALSTLFNPSATISGQYSTAKMRDGLGFQWFQDNTVLKHTTGTYSAGNVSGADQTGQDITVTAITGTFKKGDIINFDATLGVNRVTKQSTGQNRDFVILQDTPAGSISLRIYPALIPGGVDYDPDSGDGAVQYQTVVDSPANGATISVKGVVTPGTAVTYRQNFSYVRDAVTMATADLIMPKNMQETARSSQDGISMRMITGYMMGSDVLATRYDVLYGYLFIRPEWCCVMADAI